MLMICLHCKREFEFTKKGGRKRKYCSYSCKDMEYSKGLKGRTAKKRADYKWRYSQKGIEHRINYNKTTKRILQQRKNRWKRAWGGNAIKVLERDNYKCIICGFSIKECLQINHIIPRSANGNNDLNNLETLCANCHHFISIHERYALAGKREDRKNINWILIHTDSVKLLKERLTFMLY